MIRAQEPRGVSWKPLRIVGALWWLVVAMPLSACHDDSSDDDDIDFGECEIHATPIPDDKAPAGFDFAPADVRQWVEGSRESTAKWGSKDVAPELETNVKVELTRRGSAQLVRDCDGVHVGIPATLHITSGDALLDETPKIDIRAKHERFASFYVRLDSDKSLKPFRALASAPHSQLIGIEMYVSLTPEGVAGRLEPMIEQRSDDSVALLAAQPMLRWPAEDSCGVDAVPREPMQSDAEWLDPLRAAINQSWVGMRDDTPIRDVEVKLGPRVCEYEADKLTQGATILLTIDEGATPLELTGEFAIDDATAKFELARDRPWGGSAKEFENRFGDFGLDLDSFDGVELRAELTLKDDTAEGAVSVIGYTDSCEPCKSANRCPSCGASIETKLMEIALRVE